MKSPKFQEVYLYTIRTRSKKLQVHTAILHKIFGLARRIAALVAISNMTQLTVLKNGLHLDRSAPAAFENQGSTGLGVLRYVSSHLAFLQKNRLVGLMQYIDNNKESQIPKRKKRKTMDMSLAIACRRPLRYLVCHE